MGHPVCLNYLIYETRALNFAFRKLELNTIQITIQVSHKHLRGLETVLILLIYGCRWKYRIRKTCLYDTRKYLKYHSRCHGITQKSLFFWGFDRQVAAQDPRISQWSKNYQVDCSEIQPLSKDGKSPINLIPFHRFEAGEGGGRVRGSKNGQKVST